MATKEKCKYWDKCYRKDAAHKKQYEHPADTVDVTGKKIFISGNSDNINYKKFASLSTTSYGCILEKRLHKGIDYFIVGSEAGEELDEAEELDLNIVHEDEWDEMLSKSTPAAATKKKTSKVDLNGKKIVFTGALTKATRKQAAARAKMFGCIVVAGVSKNVNIVIAGSGAGQKLDRAEDLGLRVMDEDDWEEILSMSKPVRGYKASTRSKNKDSAQVSDSDDEDYSPSTKTKTIPKVRKKATKKTTHDVSESEEESDGTSPVPSTSASPKKRKLHDMSGSENEGPASKKATSDTREKCKYWNKCYRKDQGHLKQFRHPPKGTEDANEAEDEDNGEDEEDEELKPLNEMADGETIDVKGGAYRIKRTGDHYYCTCMAWKNQNRPVDSRTCKHLKEHLGDKFETTRCNMGSDAATSSGRASRSPAKAKAIPQLLLAHKWSESTNPTGWWMSEKLEGVRAYWDGTNFYSRLGNPFTPPDWFIENYPSDMELDGELFGGRGKFQSTVSIVKSASSTKWKEITYCVFDAPGIGNQPIETRLEKIREYFEENDVKTAELLSHTKCAGADNLKKELKKVEGLGGEGLMIRQPKSKYVNGRSNTLLKIKTFHDAEARVIGHDKGKGRNADRCGALRCEMESGKKFSVGSGLSDHDRAHPPKIGTIITYRFQELTNDGVPRFPSYVGVRIDMDEPKDAILSKKGTDC